MITFKGLIKLASNPKRFFYDYKKKYFSVEEKIIIENSRKILIETIQQLSETIRVYDFKNIPNDNGYIGVDSSQLVDFLEFFQGYSKEFYLEVKNSVYPLYSSNDTSSLLKVIEKSNSFYLLFNNQKEFESQEILIGDIKDDFLFFRSSDIDYKKQFYRDRSLYGIISLAQINNQYLPSAFYFEQPIDIVYTWVNSSDKGWQRLFSMFKDIDEIEQDRYMSIDELKYSLRSVERYANWVNKIYIVTNCQKPKWLDNHPKVEWVFHEKIFKKDELPTFNSHALGLTLFKIPNLSEHFLYFNDDVFLFNRVKKEDFFTPNNLSISYLEPYGIIYHDRAKYAEIGYVFSALNGKKLLEKEYKISPTQLHRHVPLAFKKSILQKMEGSFKKEINHTRKNRFRDKSDVSVSFLYNHYALYHKEAVYKATNSILVNFRNYKTQEKNILKRRPKFICINDVAGSSKNSNYTEWTKTFLEASFPKKAVWERIEDANYS